jgi:hypothetical protein
VPTHDLKVSKEKEKKRKKGKKRNHLYNVVAIVWLGNAEYPPRKQTNVGQRKRKQSKCQTREGLAVRIIVIISAVFSLRESKKRNTIKILLVGISFLWV